MKREIYVFVDVFFGWCKVLGRIVLFFVNEELEVGEGRMFVCFIVYGRAKITFRRAWGSGLGFGRGFRS